MKGCNLKLGMELPQRDLTRQYQSCAVVRTSASHCILPFAGLRRPAGSIPSMRVLASASQGGLCLSCRFSGSMRTFGLMSFLPTHRKGKWDSRFTALAALLPPSQRVAELAPPSI
jgi:hypothetical protein